VGHQLQELSGWFRRECALQRERRCFSSLAPIRQFAVLPRARSRVFDPSSGTNLASPRSDLRPSKSSGRVGVGSIMFSIVFGSLLLSLGFGAAAFEVPQIQSIMLVGACIAATAFCGSFEAWSYQEVSEPRPRRAIERGAGDRGAD
jgi:hypothetical protein